MATFGALERGISLLFPYAGLGAIINYCNSSESNSLGGSVEVTPLLRNGLYAHLAYFIGIPIFMECFPDAPGVDYLVGALPANSNAVLQLTCLAGENFFVASAALIGVLSQTSVPRYAMLPIPRWTMSVNNRIS